MASFYRQALSSFQETFEIKGEIGLMVDDATSEELMAADMNLNRGICQKCRRLSARQPCTRPIRSQRRANISD